MQVTPYFDSMIVKYTTRANDWALCVRRMRRALLEMRIKGIKTNIPFILNVLDDVRFSRSQGEDDENCDTTPPDPVVTRFIDDTPALFQYVDHPCDASDTCDVTHQRKQQQAFETERNLRYLANLA